MWLFPSKTRHRRFVCPHDVCGDEGLFIDGRSKHHPLAYADPAAVISSFFYFTFQTAFMVAYELSLEI